MFCSNYQISQMIYSVMIIHLLMFSKELDTQETNIKNMSLNIGSIAYNSLKV